MKSPEPPTDEDPEPHLPPPPPPGNPRVAAWGRLLRISLAPSAAADVAAGTVLAAGSWPAGWSPWLAILGSLCVYHGGLVLNDWADLPHDRATRPDRPLCTGLVRPESALVVAWILIGLGPLLGYAAHPRTGSALALAAVLAVVYDLWGRGPWTGPLLLAACRGANLSAGLALGASVAFAAVPSRATLVVAPLGYAAYVFLVSRLGRLEDGEEGGALGRRPSVRLMQAAAMLALLGMLAFVRGKEPPAIGPWPSLALALAGAFGLVQLALTTRAWSRPLVGAAMGAALRRLLVCTAALALGARGPHGLAVATAILAGYPLSYLLRTYFPPS